MTLESSSKVNISNLLYLSVPEALSCVEEDFNKFCGEHKGAHRCRAPAIWLVTQIGLALNDEGIRQGCH